MKEILNADSTWSILNDSNYWKTGKNPNSGRSLQTEVKMLSCPWGPGQLGLVGGVPVHSRNLEPDDV